MSRKKLYAIAALGFAFVLLVLFGGTQFLTFKAARTQIETAEAAHLQEAHTPAETRAMLESIRTEGPFSFVPHSAWDNYVCAGNVVSAVNFILGEQRLTNASAWMFEEANRDVVTRAYDRVEQYEDFAIVDGVITETNNRGFSLGTILKMVGDGDERNVARVYVVGYHYNDTLEDATIIDAQAEGGTLNSHLMLLLGTANGRWYGYHLFHDPRRPDANPFGVIDLGECLGCERCTETERCMPQMFDLMYIWEVEGTELPLEGAPIRLVQDSASYQEVRQVVGAYGTGHIDHFRDTIRAYRARLGDSYPRIVRTDTPVVELVSPYRRQQRGHELGSYNGEIVYRHIGDSQRGTHGLEYQCVEFVNRYYARVLGHRNMTRSGDADTYWYDAGSKGLSRYLNGSRYAPEPDDILTFDPEGNDTVPGHVAIVTSVTNDEVCVVQQNAQEWQQCFELEVREGLYTITDTFNDMPAVGWSRRSQ